MASYFTNLFAASDNLGDISAVTQTIRSRVLDDDNAMLMQPFEAEEFRLAVTQMHKDKAPGLDGFNPAFYKKIWGVLVRILLKIVYSGSRLALFWKT